jgi:hypothetical protein
MLAHQLNGGALYLRVTGHLDGFALRDANSGEVVQTYRSAVDAMLGRVAGHEALAQLAACLAKAL